jgi:hypothetical protein
MKPLNTENGYKMKSLLPNKTWFGSTTEKLKLQDKEKNSEITDVMPHSCLLNHSESMMKLLK